MIKTLKALFIFALFTTTTMTQASLGEAPGEQFHNIRFTDEQGNRHQLDEYKGKVVVLKFWGSWCGICQLKWPKHQALYNQLQEEKDVVFLTVSFAESLQKSQSFAHGMEYTVPLFHGSNLGLIKTVDGAPFQPLGTPYNLLLDRNGVIKQKWIGHQPGVTAEIVRSFL
ncbi:MAG: peroxiredoxin [Parasphingorhabdus sp.]|jgi:peroxiredoxin